MKKRMLVLATIGLLALMGIVRATSTMNPRITYTGNGIPDSSVGRVGDVYIDLNTSILYVMGTDGWGVFAVLPAPVNGTNGLNGATWIVGDTTPTDDLGSNGDLYFNYVSLDIFHKVDGTWIYLTTIVGQQGPVGPQGPAGTDGIDGTDGINGTDGTDGTDGINGTNGKDGRNGSMWYNELVASMTADLGFDGDYYLFANGTVYYKMNGTWVFFTSLMGQTGATGAIGATGATGATGAAGADGINGTNGIDGKDGINGTNGIDGKDGNYGINGINGQDGIVPWWLYVLAVVALGASVYSVNKSRQKPNAEDIEAHSHEMPKTLD